jgi:ribosomal subunit interface protein
MQVAVSGKGVEIGEAFRKHAETRVTEGMSKYLDRVTSVDVVVSREAHLFTVSIHSNVGTSSNLVLKSQGQSEDIYAAFDDAADKVEKQLRRYKRRLKDHHRHSSPSADQRAIEGIKYVIQSSQDEEEATDDQPVIIAEKPERLSRLSVSEAVMRMDLANLPALMFYNASTGRLNVVYRRADGNISWVDPAGEKAA